MDSRLSNPYVRLAEYFRIFKSYDCSECEIEDESNIPVMSISQLSKTLDIPIKLMRMDITNIMKYSDGGVIDFDIDEDSELSFDLEELIDNPEKLFDLIDAGFLDDIGLNFYDTFTSDCSIVINESEIEALEKTPICELPFLVKDNEFEFPGIAGLMEMIQIVDEAIEQQRYISFKYYEESDMVSVSIVPMRVIFENGTYSILTCLEGLPKCFYFDRIKTGISMGDVCSFPPGSAYMSILPQVWGTDFMADPFLVEVQFYNDTDVFNRVRTELSGRSMGNIYEKDDCLFYEDTVYGIERFEQWVKSFGNSAVVIKPKSLRNKIIAELKAI